MESDSEAAESELGEAVSVQGNLKFGKKGNKDDEIYYNFYPCLPNRASFPCICDFAYKALTSSGNSPNENSLSRNAAKFHFTEHERRKVQLCYIHCFTSGRLRGKTGLHLFLRKYSIKAKYAVNHSD